MSEVSRDKNKYDIITDYIMDYIKKNRLVDGDKLPTERSLADELNVSRTTTQRVFRDLEMKGVVYKKQGSGIYVGNKEKRNGKVKFISYIRVDKGEDEKISQFFQIIQGAEEYLNHQGCYLTVHTVTNKNNDLYEKVNELLSNNVKGIIFNSDIKMDALTYYNLVKKNCAMVFADCSPLNVNANFVSSDNLRGGYLATKHLIDIGCKRIGYIGGGENITRSLADRFSGYKLALSEHSMDLVDRNLLMDYIETKPNQYIEFINRYLDEVLSMQDPIDGIFVRNDITAIAVEQSLIERGISIPDQVAIVGFDNLSISENLKIPLTSISQDFYKLGEEAAKICLKSAEGNNALITQILTPVDLIIRESTKRKSNGTNK